jgi:predicted RNase H-like HicB family nuclease
MPSSKYPIVIEALTNDRGGGFLARVPDLPGCMAEGETREAAARGIANAITAWIDEAEKRKQQIPCPSQLLVVMGLTERRGAKKSRRLRDPRG